MNARFADIARFAAAAQRCDERAWPEEARRFAAEHGSAFAREVLRTLSLFFGFPPVLRALDLAADTLAARGAADPVPRTISGAEAFAEVYGSDAAPVLARLGELDPQLRCWVIEHAYGRAYAGPLLDLQERERLAVLALAATHCWKQCDSHLRACLRLGVSLETLCKDASAGDWLPNDARATLLARIMNAA